MSITEAQTASPDPSVGEVRMDLEVDFGRGLTAAAPGSALAGLTVPDIEAAHDEVVGRGIDASDIWHGPPSLPRPGSPASTPSAPATDRSSPSTIPTAMCG